ncbi:MAG: hypothetical protein AAF616_10355 [Bacteroidota bacterium]
MRPDQSYNKRIDIKLRSLEVNYYKGNSIVSTVIRAATVDFNIGINDLSSFQIKVPYQWAEGNLGSNGGLGDISLSYTRLLKTTNRWDLNGTLGAKIPSTDGNKTVNNFNTGFVDAPIHMYYQNSLGSYDAIAGFAAVNGKWLLATGVQVALTANNNQFTWEDGQNGFPDYPSREYLIQHNIGRELKRGVDVMIRVERNWRFTNFNFSLGALPIWRVTQDEAIPGGETERRKIENTTGLALSAIGSFGYQFDVNNSIKIIRGIKITDRKVNPDGLTRDDVWSVSYIYKF